MDAANSHPRVTMWVLLGAVVAGTVFVLPVLPTVQATLIAGALLYGAPVVAAASLDVRRAERGLVPVPARAPARKR